MYDPAQILNDAINSIFGRDNNTSREGNQPANSPNAATIRRKEPEYDLPEWLKQIHADYESGRASQKIPAQIISATITQPPAATPKIRPDGWRPDGFRQLTEALKQGWQPDETTEASIIATNNNTSASNNTIQEQTREYRPGDVTPMRRLVQKVQREQHMVDTNTLNKYVPEKRQTTSAPNNINASPDTMPVKYKPSPTMDNTYSDGSKPATATAPEHKTSTQKANAKEKQKAPPKKSATEANYPNKPERQCEYPWEKGPDCNSALITEPEDYLSPKLMKEYERIYQASIRDKKEKACWINEDKTKTGNCKTLDRIDGGDATAPMPVDFGQGTMLHVHPKDSIYPGPEDWDNENGRGVIITKDQIYTFGYLYNPETGDFIKVRSRPISRKSKAKK